MQRIVFGLIATLLIGTTFFYTGIATPIAAQENKPPITRWEYKILNEKSENVRLSESRLRGLGREGWELTTSVMQEDRYIVHFLKRPLQ